MYKYFFLAYFICVAAQNQKIYSFDQNEAVLAKCIVQQLVNFDGTFKSTQIAKITAYLTAKRFHGKTMSSNSFNNGFRRFICDLRKRKLSNDFKKDEISELLRVALRQATIKCADIGTVKKEVTIESEKLISFSRNKYLFNECIKNHLNRHEFHLKAGIIEFIADSATKRFNGKTMLNKNFNNRFRKFIYHLRQDGSNNIIKKDELSEKLRVEMKRTLIICANTTTVKDEGLILNDDSISFGQNKHLISECIVNHLKLTGFREFILEDKVTKLIADSAASWFLGKSMSRKVFLKKHWSFFDYLQKNKLSFDNKISQLFRKLESTIRQAVEDCAVDKLPLVAVPTFKNEPSRMAHILDLILVKWPKDLYDMIQTRDGRATLRRYANDALTALTSELNGFGNDTQVFRVTLRLLWVNRAQKMYDENSVDLPYIIHSYTFNYPIPHMVQSDFEKLINRSSLDFGVRSPKVSDSHLLEILNIHKPNRLISDDDVDIYDDYTNHGMSCAEYYIENQINQFYRVLFFFLELQARKICTNEDDVFPEALPNDLVPEHVQAIVYDDDVYRDYLSNQRLFFKRQMSNIQNEIAQNLLDHPRVLEENLLLLMFNVPSTSIIQLRSESTTSKSLKRKDDVWKNENGKCFSKQGKKTMTSNICSIDDNLDTKSLDEVASSTVQESCNYFVPDEDSSMCFFDEFGASLKREKNVTDNLYGYVFSDDDSKQFQFFYEDFMVIQDEFAFTDN